MVIHTAIEQAELPLSEPEIIGCPYLTGADFTIEHGVLRFTGWESVDGERRVKVRYAIAVATLRPLHARFRQMLVAMTH